MDQDLPEPTAGGSYQRDPATGALSVREAPAQAPADDRAVAEPAAPATTPQE